MAALFPAAMHPQVVHFTIVLVIIGVALRAVSLLGRPAFASPAAATLLLLAALSAVVSVRTGTAAHGPVERVPGARPAVQAHEESGERAQIVLLLIGLIELGGLALRKSPRARLVHVLATVVGLAGVWSVYEAGEHGGALVYSYAGGVGTRTGDPKDVDRLFVAGNYQVAMADRAAGRGQQAADLIAATATRYPADVDLQVLAAESQLLDLKNPQGTIDALAKIQAPQGNRVFAFRKASLLADAYLAAGQKDQAVAALEEALKVFANPRLQKRIDDLKAKTS